MPAEHTAAGSALDRTRYARLLALFHEAMNLPNQERRAFVESACAGDTTLLAVIVGMLDEDNGPSLLDQDLGTLAHAIFGPQDSLDLAQVGPYRLIRMLGEGGMGMVYLAERADFGNPVAIKFLRDAWLSPARRDRFLSEQRLLAPLIHPAIARFYDAGTLNDGAPWFAMEYVEGLPVTEYCRHRQCTLEQRLQLFCAICGAVQYAHRHAVIHRDLKPSNILVKADGAVRLLDFGIAKQLIDLREPVDQTQTSRFLTPAYAAPEQIRGEPVGVFTDIHALGIILYELLAGRLPFDLSNLSFGEAERAIVEIEPEKPSVAARRAPSCCKATAGEWADLDVLCLTAIRKDPARRYRSVDALIKDLEAFLNGTPLEARPDSLWYRTAKFTRRHRAAVTTIAVALIVLICAASIFTVRLARARDAALAEAARTNRLQRFTESLFDGGDPSAGPPSDLTTSVLLQRGLTQAESLRDDPRMQADMFATLGQAYQHLGYLDRADLLLNRALHERQNRFGTSDAQYAESLLMLGLLRKDQGRMDEAERILRESLAAARQPTNNDQTVAGCLAALGSVLNLRAKYAESKRLLEEAVARARRSPRQTIQLADSLSQLADVHFYLDDYERSRTLNHQALTAYRNLFGNDHPAVARVLDSLGNIAQNQGHFGAAEALFRQSLAIDRKWYGGDHSETAAILFSLGKTLISSGRYDEGKAALERVLLIRRAKYGENHPGVALSLNELGTLAYNRDRDDEAYADFQEALAIWKKVYGEQHPFIGLGYANLTGIYMDRKDYRNAEVMARKALAVYSAALPKNHVNVAIMHVKLGRILLRQNRYAEAEPETLEGFKYFSQHETQYRSYAAGARKDLAEIEGQLGQR